jgi:hypothetical protein
MYVSQLKNITTKQGFNDWCSNLNDSSAFKRMINSNELRVSQCPFHTCLHGEFKNQKFSLCYYTADQVFASLCHILCAFVQGKSKDEISIMTLENFKDILDFYGIEHKIGFQRILNHTKYIAAKIALK